MPQLNRSPVVPLVATLLVGALVVGFLIFVQSVDGPTVQIPSPPIALGQGTRFDVTAEASRGGVKWVEARLRRGETVTVLDRQTFEGPVENVRTATLTIDAAAAGLSEGDGFLEVLAGDGFWRPRDRSQTVLFSAPIRVDLTPPPLSVVSATRYPTQGGAAVCVTRTEEDAWVQIEVGDRRFPATTPSGSDAGLRVGLFAVPWDLAPDASLLAVATDAAGNRTVRELPVVLKRKRFETGNVDIPEDFVRRKAQELLPPGEADGDPTVAFVKINRDMRAASAQRKREIGKASGPERLWQGAFVQPRNTRVFSNFAESRDYRMGGRTVDTQVHLGFDLASVRQAPIPAANAGRVAFAGPLSIYGNAVILDHGWGLQTLYAHCSSLAVQVGDMVEKGQEIARTGTTGLAVGDHLHYEVMVRGIPVSPLQWWDGQWIEDHILQPLRDGGVGVASR